MMLVEPVSPSGSRALALIPSAASRTRLTIPLPGERKSSETRYDRGVRLFPFCRPLLRHFITLRFSPLTPLHPAWGHFLLRNG